MDAIHDSAAAPLIEVFASIQGEGAWVGEPQVFVRLAGCPLRCSWCDTPESWVIGKNPAKVHGLKGVEERDPWASPFIALTWILSAEPREPRTISITGGEPLMWPGFIRGLGNIKGPRRVHLETAGAHPEALASVLDMVDHVSLDLKPDQDMGPVVPLDVEGPLGERSWGEESPKSGEEWRLARRRCLALIADHDACAKLIISADRGTQDYLPLLEDLAQVAPQIPLFLQPVTPCRGISAPDPSLLTDVVEDARDLGLTVRVVPQVHKTLGIQ